MTFYVEFPGAMRLRDRVRRVMRGIHNEAAGDPHSMEAIARDSVSRNFASLSWGGSQVDAAGMTHAWSQRRSSTTKAERSLSGHGPVFPMLQVSGSMKDAFTSGLVRGQSFTSGDGMGQHESFLEFSTLNSEAAEKGFKNQFGGKHDAHFPLLGITKTLDFPERPFLFWDQQSPDEVAKLLTLRYFPKAAARVRLDK